MEIFNELETPCRCISIIFEFVGFRITLSRAAVTPVAQSPIGTCAPFPIPREISTMEKVNLRAPWTVNTMVTFNSTLSTNSGDLWPIMVTEFDPGIICVRGEINVLPLVTDRTIYPWWCRVLHVCGLNVLAEYWHAVIEKHKDEKK